MFVCEEGRLSCRKSAHDALVIYWKFECGGVDSGSHMITLGESPDFSQFSHALAIGAPLLSVAGAQWLQTLIENIEMQFKQQRLIYNASE